MLAIVRNRAVGYLRRLESDAKEIRRRGAKDDARVAYYLILNVIEAFLAIRAITKEVAEAHTEIVTKALAGGLPPALKSELDRKVSVEYGFIVMCGPCQFGGHLENFPEKCWVAPEEGADQTIVFLSKESACKYVSNRTEATRPITPLTVYPCFYVESAQRLHPWPSWIPEGGAVLVDAVLRLEQETTPCPKTL